MQGSNQIKRGPVTGIVRLVCAVILVLATAVPLIADETEETVLPWSSKKTDVIVLVNGDRLTGEIKSLDRGKLSFSTDDMGTIRIEWLKIVSVESRQVFEVETEGFRRFYGSLVPASEEGWLAISGDDMAYNLQINRVVRITPLRGSFWRRLKVSLDAGYSFTSAHSQQQMTLGSEISYRTERYLRQLNVSTFYTDREGEESTSRSLASFNYARFFKDRPRAFFTGLTSLEQNDELGLDRRATAGIAVGRHAVQTNQVLLGLLGGLTVTQESFTGSTGDDLGWDDGVENSADDYNLDALLAMDISVVRWDDPELDFSTTLSLFPSLTSWGRLRARLDSRLRYEVFSDFFVGLSGFLDYDNEPPVEGVENTDFSVSLTVGWTFNK